MSKNLPAKKSEKKISKKEKPFLSKKEKNELLDAAEEEASSVIIKAAKVCVPILIGALFKKIKSKNSPKKKSK